LQIIKSVLVVFKKGRNPSHTNGLDELFVYT